MTGLDRRPGNAQRHQSRLIKADEGEKQPDAYGKAVAKAGGHAVHYPLAQPEYGKENEGHSREEDGGQRGLPRKAEHLADRESDEGILAHIRRDCERPIGVKAIR